MVWLPEHRPIPVMSFSVTDDFSSVAADAARRVQELALQFMGIAKIGGTYIYCADCSRRIKKTDQGYAAFRRHRSRKHPHHGI